MKLFNVELSNKESAFVRRLFRQMSDKSFREVSDEEKLHRILASCLGDNAKNSWSKEELKLLASDKSDAEIAEELGRSRRAVQTKRARLSGKNW